MEFVSRWWLGTAGAVALLTGCTSLLGIDGTYVTDQSAGASQPGTGGSTGDAAPAAGDAGSGGSSDPGAGGSGGAQDSGGASGNAGAGGAGGVAATDGGASSGGAIGAGGEPPVDAGCVACNPPPPDCKPGLYEGKFNGNHSAGVALGFGNLPILNGDISFRLSSGPSPLPITSGKLHGAFAWGSFDVTLTGSFDCATGLLNGTLQGKVSVAPVSPAVSGTLTGQLLASSSTTRRWAEHEAGVTATPGPTTPGTGVGDWSAAWSTP